MESMVSELSLDEIIDFHSCANKLMQHQLIEAGDDWLIILEKEIGLDQIFRWSVFVGKAIREDFRNSKFQSKAKRLSHLLQDRFSDIGLDISLWSPVFFYLGMIYTYSKFKGFIKVTHTMKKERMNVLLRLDETFREAITYDKNGNYFFIDSRKENPFEITDYIIRSGLMVISSIDIFTVDAIDFPISFDEIPDIRIHIPKETVQQIEGMGIQGLLCTY